MKGVEIGKRLHEKKWKREEMGRQGHSYLCVQYSRAYLKQLRVTNNIKIKKIIKKRE